MMSGLGFLTVNLRFETALLGSVVAIPDIFCRNPFYGFFIQFQNYSGLEATLRKELPPTIDLSGL